MKTKRPKRVIVGKIYMVRDFEWRQVRIVSVNRNKVTVRESKQIGEPFVIQRKHLFLNLIK